MASKREGKSKRSNKKQKSQEISEFIDQKRPAIDLALTKVKGSEGVAYNARFFYVLANFHDDWVLLEFDLLFKQKFTMYNAMELASHFAFFDFKFTPYDHDQGLVYDEERIVKVELDHEEKKLNVISEFILPQDPESGLVFHIHTVLILQNDTVFIYTTRQNNHISQRLYLQKWDDLEERLNMCKIGIRDASDSLLFVSGQFVEDKKLCIVQMQDKHRQYGQITPLSLYWDTDGPVGPTKFEKVECEDGKPFVTTIGRGQPGSRKQFTGAWHEQFFTMIFSRPNSRWQTLEHFRVCVRSANQTLETDCAAYIFERFP
ncbi:hypothetical protein M3Y97_01113100 [Aphelenchoides bicaudatus]|nr:hypothetical protein M3Y97_01113100 [Aphelenchoides bicaudatus]